MIQLITDILHAIKDAWIEAYISSPLITSTVTLIFMLYLFRPVIQKMKPFIKKYGLRRKLRKITKTTKPITPKQFFRMRNQGFGGKGNPKYLLSKNFAGVYILHNKTNNKYYVGQATQILNRVNNHFTGKGNGDVYADYKNGHKWTIQLIALKSSPFPTLNQLERHMIQKYKAYTHGYNKTSGNK